MMKLNDMQSNMIECGGLRCCKDENKWIATATYKGDLFDKPQLIPRAVCEILWYREYEQPEVRWQELEMLLGNIEPLGYTFDYYLDEVPYDLRVMEPSEL